MTMESSMNKCRVARAQEMLQIAADYIREYYPDAIVFYDDADCDGYCIANDCEIAAKELNEV